VSDERDERGRPGGRSPLANESGILVFGGGGASRGCAGRGYLFWIVVSVVLSVALTVFANLVLLLFSGGGSGVGV
jgi:hypothetical protein